MLPGCEQRHQSVELRTVANASVYLLDLLGHAEAIYLHVSASDAYITGDHLESCCFAGAVYADEAKALALVDAQ